MTLHSKHVKDAKLVDSFFARGDITDDNSTNADVSVID